MRVAILATGPSLTEAQVEAVRGLYVIAVSDAWRLAPWAQALVSADAAWWRHHQPVFAGRRISNSRVSKGERFTSAPNGTNSGALAVRVALEIGAKEMILLGFDGHGTHFFGPHPNGLKNTDDHRRSVHFVQHRKAAAECRRAGVPVWNCSPGTVIDAYEIKTLEKVLCSQPAADAIQARTNTSYDR